MPFDFDEIRSRFEGGDDAAKQQAINDLLAHYLAATNPVLRKLASRIIFQQLRPVYSADDIVSQVLARIAKKLKEGELELRTEKEFLSYTSRLMLYTISDLAGSGPGSRPGPKPGGEQADTPARGPGVSTQVQAEEVKQELLRILADRLTTDELYLIRRYYFEGAGQEEIANEVLRPAADPVTDKERENRSARIHQRIARVREKLKNEDDGALVALLVR